MHLEMFLFESLLANRWRTPKRKVPCVYFHMNDLISVNSCAPLRCVKKPPNFIQPLRFSSATKWNSWGQRALGQFLELAGYIIMMSVGNSSCSRHKGTCSDDGLGFLITYGRLCVNQPGGSQNHVDLPRLVAGLRSSISGIVLHSRCGRWTSVRACTLWTIVRHKWSPWCSDQRLCIQWYAPAKPRITGFGCHLRGKPLTLWLAGPQRLWTSNCNLTMEDNDQPSQHSASTHDAEEEKCTATLRPFLFTPVVMA